MKFTVKGDPIIFIITMIVVGISGVMLLLYTLFETNKHLVMYIITILFAMCFALPGIRVKRYCISVNGSKITVQKGFALKPFIIDITEITRVFTIVSNTYAGININMKIYTSKGKKFNVETLMLNSDKMFDFIDKNISKEIVETKFIDLVSK